MPTSPPRPSTDYKDALRKNTKNRDTKGNNNALPKTASRTRSSKKKIPTTTKSTTRGGKEKQIESHNSIRKDMDIDKTNIGIATATAGLSSNDKMKVKETLSVSLEEDMDLDKENDGALDNHGKEKDNKSDTSDQMEENLSLDDINDGKVTYYMNVKFTVSASDKILQDIRDKYKSLLTTLLEADEDLVLLSADPAKSQLPITDPTKIPEKMTKMGKYFQSTSRPPKEDEGDIWSTFRISAQEDLEDILQATEYDLRDENIVLMRKRLQCFKTSTPGYFQFIDNKIDPLDLFNQITEDIGRNYTWTIVIKKPWEGFQKKDKIKSKSKGYNKENFLARAPHIECMSGEEDDLIQTIRRWIKCGKAEFRFGPHVKYIEALTSLSHPQQVERTLRMNAYGKRFQSSIDMVELSGLNNPSGLYDGDYLTIRCRILAQSTPNDEAIFLSVTKKWGSSLWQATYIAQRRNEAIDFAACPAAWLTQGEDEDFQAIVFKSFDPYAVQEARESTWDEETQRIITPSEKEANDDEEDAANIPWLLDLQHMDKDNDDDEVKFTSGVNFNFSEDISVKTTRVHGDTNDTGPEMDVVSTPSPTRKSNISILRSPSDGCSVNSAITMDTRMTTLETTLDQILDFMKSNKPQQGSTISESTSGVTTQNATSVTTPTLPEGGVGE